jgi:hypothetical protein
VVGKSVRGQWIELRSGSTAPHPLFELVMPDYNVRSHLRRKRVPVKPSRFSNRFSNRIINQQIMVVIHPLISS